MSLTLRFSLMFLCFVGLEAFATTKVTVQLGEPLRSALDRYGDAGLNVISTTLTLPIRIKVIDLPDPTNDLRDQVVGLLKPHQLELVMVDESNGYVRKQPTKTIPPPAVSQIVKARPMEEIVVTSHYQIHRNSSTVKTLEQRDLISLPSVGRDILRGMQILPGVASSGISARHRLRGGDANETLYRLDGIELLAPFHLPSVQSLFSSINAHAIEAADVYISGFPVSMGSRMSGVVDLIPVDPVADFTGGVDINPVMASVDARGRQDDWSWIFSVRQSLLDKSLGQFDTDFGDPHFEDRFARIVHDNSKHSIVFGLLRTADRLTAFNDGANERSRSEYQALWLDWTHYYSDRLEGNWRVSSISVDLQRSGQVDLPSVVQGELLERRDFHTLEIENDWRWRISKQVAIEGGWSVAKQSGDFNARLNIRYESLAIPIQGIANRMRETTLSRKGETTAAYLSSKMQLTNALNLEIGVRYDGQDIDPIHVNEVSARATIEYQLSDAWQVSLNVGRYTQQQQLYEIQIDDGKAELDAPQHSDQVNFTTIWQATDAVRWRLDLYHREIRDPWSRFDNLYNRWVLLPELRGDRVEIAPTRGRLQGAELGFEYSTAANWSIHTSYAYGTAREQYLGKFRERPWQQKHTFKLGYNWQSERWRVGLAGTFRSGWPTTPLITQTEALSAQIYEDQLPNYFSLDAHIAYQHDLSTGQLELYLDITNLSNRENIGGYDYTLSAESDAQNLFPIFPTIGAMWRW